MTAVVNGAGRAGTRMAGRKAGTAKRRRVSGVDRVFQILDHLMERGTAARALDIARAVGAPSSTVYEVIEDLVARRALTRDGDGLVSLGPRLLHYGLAYRQATPFLDVAQREMRRLSAEVGESVQICGRDGDMMVVLAMADGPGPFRVTSHVGTRVPLNWTASGRLLTGHLPEAERIALYRNGARPSPTGRAETDAKRLAAASRNALEERLSIQLSESDYAVACIAAPIVDLAGECVATISIVLSELRAQAAPERFAGSVTAAAHAIETTLGWDRRDEAAA
jgi:DNA-binding IclR family transcriptional regulator